MRDRLTTWYLQMGTPAALRPAPEPSVDAPLLRVEHPSPAFSRFLYTAVGGGWFWRDRLPWTYAQWWRWLDRSELETWVLYVDGTPAGYIELEQQAHGDVEIAYFGLLPAFIGRGLGGHLLTRGIARAWSYPGTRRVWVHSCSLDGPAALANYQARGLVIYRVEETDIERPEHPDGPWPGWDRDGADGR